MLYANYVPKDTESNLERLWSVPPHPLLSSRLPFSSLWAIVGINCVGSFMIGCLFKQFGNQVWMFAVIGFCGAFTTFSTYSLDVIRLLMAGNIQTVLLYVISMNGVSLLSCWLGIKLFN